MQIILLFLIPVPHILSGAWKPGSDPHILFLSSQVNQSPSCWKPWADLEDGKNLTMPSAVAGLHMRWVWFLLVFHLCRTTYHGWQYLKLHRPPNTRPHTLVAAPGLDSVWKVLRFPFNQPFLHSWKIYFYSKRNTAFICQMPRGTTQCWTIAHNISV